MRHLKAGRLAGSLFVIAAAGMVSSGCPAASRGDGSSYVIPAHAGIHARGKARAFLAGELQGGI